MFYTIDYENWERKEIFERFAGYTYNLTAEADVTNFLEAIHEKVTNSIRPYAGVLPIR